MRTLNGQCVSGCTKTANAYIGLNDVAVEGTFVWTNGQPVIYTAWYNFGIYTNPTSEDCVFQNDGVGFPSAGWRSTSCTSELAYICEFLRTPTAAPTFRPSVTPTRRPSKAPTAEPTAKPSKPTEVPTSSAPSGVPTSSAPSFVPTSFPTEVCSPGYFLNMSTQPRCNPCPSGTISTSYNSFYCTTCPEDEVASEGSSSCEKCFAGTEPSNHNSKCSECTPGEYSTTNMTKCAECPSQSTSLRGSDSCDLFILDLNPIIPYTLISFCSLCVIIVLIKYMESIWAIGVLISVIEKTFDAATDILYVLTTPYASKLIWQLTWIPYCICFLPYIYHVYHIKRPGNSSSLFNLGGRCHQYFNSLDDDYYGWIVFKWKAYKLSWEFLPFAILLTIFSLIWPFLRILITVGAVLLSIFFVAPMWLVFGYFLETTGLIELPTIKKMWFEVWFQDFFHPTVHTNESLVCRLGVILIEFIFQTLNNKLVGEWSTPALLSIATQVFALLTIGYYFFYHGVILGKQFKDINPYDPGELARNAITSTDQTQTQGGDANTNLVRKTGQDDNNGIVMNAMNVL